MTELCGEKVRLRALEPEDLDLLLAWENDSRHWPISGTLHPYSRASLQAYLQRDEQDWYRNRQLRLMVMDRSEEQSIGTIDLFDFEPRHSRAAVGLLIAQPEARGRGMAAEALRLLSAYAFAWLGLHQLYAHVPLLNAPSRWVFTQNAFRESGTLTDWWWNGQAYCDVCVYQKMRTEK